MESYQNSLDLCLSCELEPLFGGQLLPALHLDNDLGNELLCASFTDGIDTNVLSSELSAANRKLNPFHFRDDHIEASLTCSRDQFGVQSLHHFDSDGVVSPLCAGNEYYSCVSLNDDYSPDYLGLSPDCTSLPIIYSPAPSDSHLSIVHSPLQLPIDEKYEYGDILSALDAEDDFFFTPTTHARSSAKQPSQLIFSSSSCPIIHDEQAVQCIAEAHESFADATGAELELNDLIAADLDDPEHVRRILEHLAGLNSRADQIVSRPSLSPISSDDVDFLVSEPSSSPALLPYNSLAAISFSSNEGDVVITLQASSPKQVSCISKSSSIPQIIFEEDTTFSSECIEDDDDDDDAMSDSLSVSTLLSSASDNPSLSSFWTGSSQSDHALHSIVRRSLKPQDHRRLKKKEQNKTAALRYRQKKREEKGVVLTEVEQLELHNEELKAKVSDLSREISYLKGLLDEICQQ